MSKNSPNENRRVYIDRVREQTSAYSQQLLAEFDKLRTVLNEMEGERGVLQQQISIARTLLQENEELRVLTDTLETDRKTLQAALYETRQKLDACLSDQLALQQRLGAIEAESRALTEQYVNVEQQNANLANLYVASYSIHSSVDRSNVLAALQEIVINLIGSEELVIYELSATGHRLTISASFGVDPEPLDHAPIDRGLIGRAFMTGETIVVHDRIGLSPEEERLTVAIPLRLEERVVGVIAIYELLAQKSGLEAIDHELFDLLATHAASALYCARLHETFGTRQPAEVA